GIDNDYFVAQAWAIASGRSFTDGELRGGRAACIIGETVRSKLLGSGDPIGRLIRVGKVSCEVIGLLEAKGQSSFGTDQDDTVLMPLRTFQRRISGNTEIARIMVSARDGTDTAKLQADIEALMRER
ncbi:MAG: ABC transporter permease, partial [Hyphomicrobiaceae bacterium]|nr:ABC transporter permease [Hyphomicrobiaceae bacterium]